MPQMLSMLPWLLLLLFWGFVIWAVLALIGALREIRTELQRIREQLTEKRL